MPTQRQGHATRLIWYPEDAGSWNTDPGSPAGVVAPIRQQSPFGANDSLIEAPVFMGGRLPFGIINGYVNFDRTFSFGLEYEVLPFFLHALTGPNGYSRPGAGTNKLHRFIAPLTVGAVPGSGQLQGDYQEATAEFLRNKGCLVGGFDLGSDGDGVAAYDARFLGSGSEAQTDLAGTVTDHGYKASSYFNGNLYYDGSKRADVVSYRCGIDPMLQRQDVVFNSGVAGHINSGVINARGRLDLLYNDLSFRDEGVNQITKSIDLVIMDGPELTCTKFMRIYILALRFARGDVPIGGNEGLVIGQDWQMVRDETAMKFAAEVISENTGPYNIVVTTGDLLAVKIDGGAPQNITLTAGAARTAAQIVTDINATLTGGVADVWAGRVRIKTNLAGTGGSVQIDATSTADTALGYDNVARPGLDDCPFLLEVFNARTTNYS